MTYCKQRQDLIDDGLQIPVFNENVDFEAGIVSEYITLADWVKVIDETDNGVVTTEIGTFDSIDLEYKEV